MTRKAAVTTWLEKRNGAVFTVFTSLAAFSAYACLYVFRKPFGWLNMPDSISSE